MIGAMWRALILAVALPALASSGPDRVVGNCHSSQVRPKAIILACADANAYLDKIHWQAFGGPAASASGEYVENTCTPNCASGHFKSYPVTFSLSEAKPCFDGHKDYRKLAMDFSAARPPQTPVHFDETLFCPIG